MNKGYLDTLPEIKIDYPIELEEGEKVVFYAVLSVFGTEKDRFLGQKSPFILTNKRMVMDNGLGTWTTDVTSVVGCEKVQTGFWIFKSQYFSITLNKTISFGNEGETLSGYHLYFSKADFAKFEEFASHWFA